MRGMRLIGHPQNLLDWHVALVALVAFKSLIMDDYSLRFAPESYSHG